MKSLNWPMLHGRRTDDTNTLKLRYPFQFLDKLVEYLG
eukprot:CAMPEP_0183568322 /NCGR_PEP_ID=MMETSP0371-20130417/116923_1 /TAXON_ID=268820 /ORGANISM="Peridinium aciculiferum, Strain PAER-2" /LENGTH=37 /DNA_ID= /DNA_START= /DNA_END= /DNA_ORIENTATION=